MNKDVKVLVIDDDRRMVKTICDIILLEGYSAEPAYSGMEAVEKVKTVEPDCVLMDLRMEGIDGIETLKLLKRVSPDLPVVMMSAYATDEQMEEARLAGAYTVLTKPLDIQMVLSFIALLRKEKTVLVVDDDPDFCRMLRNILAARGYHVETEANAEKVLDHMEHDYKLLVLLDYNLGTMNGVDVLGNIRARYPTKPVVLATGYREEMSSTIEKARSIGAYTCLYKPFEADGLIRIIEEIRVKKLRAFLGEPFENRSE